MSLQSLSFRHCLPCTYLGHLFGAEHFSAVESLVVKHCGVTSLQALSQLGEGLQSDLRVMWFSEVRDKVLELPQVHYTAMVLVGFSDVREVVLAGGCG
jgi:hypothetical protein